MTTPKKAVGIEILARSAEGLLEATPEQLREMGRHPVLAPVALDTLDTLRKKVRGVALILNNHADDVSREKQVAEYERKIGNDPKLRAMLAAKLQRVEAEPVQSGSLPLAPEGG